MSGEVYTNTFGGQNVNPAFLSYAGYTTDTNLELMWPFEAISAEPVAAAKLDIIATATFISIVMPPANQVSVGQDILITNIGANTFAVTNNDGVTLATIASGQSWFLYLTDNDTTGGLWRVSQLGAGTSTANAGTLAGWGLRARFTQLDQNVNTFNQSGDYTFTDADRASVRQNTGGVATYTLPSPGAVTNGWFVYVINAGSGSLTIAAVGGALIDAQSTKILAPTETAMIFCDGVNFHTLGYGRSLVNTVTGASINVAGAGIYNLTSSEVAAQVQDFTGTLTGDRIAEYGGGVGYWFVRNNTSGAHELRFRLNSLDPGVVVLPGNFSILRSNGTNLEIAFTATSGTVTAVTAGTGLATNTTGNVITSTGTIRIADIDPALTPGTYGDPPVPGPGKYPIITLNAQGQATVAVEQELGTAAFATLGVEPGEVPVIGTDGNLPAETGAATTGDISYSLAVSKVGWLWATGGTISKAGSGGTNRANDDCHALFLLLWTWNNANFVVTPSRGATAEADWGAGKQISVPDLRGCFIAGLDAQNAGASRGLLAPYFPNSTIMGTFGGQNSVQYAVSVNVSVSGGISGSTSGNMWFDSANQGGFSTGGIANPNWYGGIVGGGDVLHGDHYHDFRVYGPVVGALPVGGSFSGSGSGSGVSDVRTNLPPAVLFNTFIKL